MESISLLLKGFGIALSFQNIFAALFGGILGLIVGAMPGIGSLAGCALLLPLTFKFNPVTAIIMLGAIYYANMYGGAFSAILINIPGDAPAVMTAMDGYPLTQKGKPGKALFAADISSFIGGLIGMTILVFLGPALATFGLKFGPSEITMLMLVAMTSISWLVGENPIAGIVSTCCGILISTIGIDIVSGTIRYDFGNIYLLGGLNFIPLVIGVVGMSQIFDLLEKAEEERGKPKQKIDMKISFRDSLLTKNELKRLILPSIRSGILGTFIGFLPGAGATTGSFLGYAIQKKVGKNEIPLGTGAVEGIAASEAANNAAAAGAFGPLLSLGIPGSGTTAVLLGGLMMWGLNPGPMLFKTDAEFAWGLIASLFISNLIVLAISMGAIPYLVKILSVPVGIMIPSILTICFVGAYSTSNSMFGVVVMLCGGFAGYVLKRCNIPSSPLLLSFVLAGTLETNVRRAFLIADGHMEIFLKRPITLTFVIIFLILVGTPMVKSIIRRIKK
ncbi:MAG: tripartite tricarboxylate transporter permease [Candidatus Ornithospirochaeta sp.]